MNTINEIAARILPLDKILLEKAQSRLNNLTKPLGSLGRLEELARQIVGITGKENPDMRNKVIFTC